MVCIAGIGDCGGSSPAPVADTCEEALKKYQNSPTTSELLSLIASLEGGGVKVVLTMKVVFVHSATI